MTEKVKNLFTLNEIAEWGEGNIVKLPQVQRAFVWKPFQIENLWDSLLRGYPVGAFVLSPRERPREFELLDGQQRATAICLGFGKDTWRDSQNKIRIFIDLGKPKRDDNREYIFRVITRSHPWGYQRTDNTKTLTSENIRNAMNRYGDADYLSAALDLFFPYESLLAIPFQLFLNEANKENRNFDNLIKEINNQKNWIVQIEMLKEKNSIIRKEFQELSNSEEILNRIKVIFDKVIKMLNPISGQQIPALYLDFNKFREDLNEVSTKDSNQQDSNDDDDDEEVSGNEIENPKDEIENLFIRLNSGGTPLKGEELNYSLLKSKIEYSLQEKIENKCIWLFSPSRFITIAYRLFQFKYETDKRDALTMRIKPKQFQRIVIDKIMEFQQYIKEDLLENIIYNDYPLIEYIKNIIEYNEKTCPYGLPYLITSRIADVAPEVMFILLYRVLFMGDRFDNDEKLHRRMIGMMTLFLWLGRGEKQRDHAKLLSNIWPCASTLKKEDFWSSSTIRRAMLNETLISFPSYDKSTNSFKLKHFGQKKVRSNNTLKKQMEQTEYRLFFEKMIYNKDLVIFAQRKFISDQFRKKQFNLDDTDVPFDWDHIFPVKYIRYKQNLPKIIKSWYYTIGNLRAWPFSLNRMDQEDIPAIKLDPLNKRKYIIDKENKFDETKRRWKQYFQLNGMTELSANVLKKELLEWSFCDYDDQWAECNLKNVKRDWKMMYKRINERTIKIFEKWYMDHKIEELIPDEREDVKIESVIDKRRWDSYPDYDRELKPILFEEDTKVYVSKSVLIKEAPVYIYIKYFENIDDILDYNGVEFGICEKSNGDFIKKINLTETEKVKYHRGDQKNSISNEFTLISLSEDSFIYLFKEFKEWLEDFPNVDVKKLADTIHEYLVQKYQNMIKNINS